MKRLLLAAALTLAAAGLPRAQAPAEPLDVETIGRIRTEGLEHSQVMDHVSWLSDVYGPRVTGTPALDEAARWVEKTLASWGLSNIHRETWPFGEGWSLVRFSAHMIEPQIQPLIGSPAQWTPGTRGTITADVVRIQIDSTADFEKYRGRLGGKIVLAQPVREVRMLQGPFVLRMGEKELREAETAPVPAPPILRRPAAQSPPAPSLASLVRQFYRSEGVAAIFNRGSDATIVGGGSDLSWRQQRPDGGTIFPGGGGPRTGDAKLGPPTVTLAVEHYNRMLRIIEKGLPVVVELNLETRFYEETAPNGFNLIAEIPGADPRLRSEVVMIGAHLDSVAAATGATDNAAGSAAMMEAMRILVASGARPRRTIRLALWGGEEEGDLGSHAYVRRHFGDASTMTLTPEHAKLSAYFNSDNGTGRVRGIWLQGNLAVEPIFRRWIEPLRDLGVTTLGPRPVSQTDHVAFDRIGLPAFQLMVDRLEYNSRTHHSNMDFYERVQPDDMIQQATVVAVLAYQAAVRDEMLPRKPLPAAR
jgi:hypothetical protein